MNPSDTAARVWTYRSSALWAKDEASARQLILAEAHAMIPEDIATATILSLRQTPTGRWSAMVKRVRQPEHAPRLTRRGGWGVECPCGWRIANSRTLPKAAAQTFAAQHGEEAR